MIEIVSRILAEYTDVPEDLNAESNLFTDLKLTSLDLVSMAANLQDELGIEIPDRMLTQVNSIGDVCSMIEKLRG